MNQIQFQPATRNFFLKKHEYETQIVLDLVSNKIAKKNKTSKF